MIKINSISDVVDKYDNFIIDQWGKATNMEVIHGEGTFDAITPIWYRTSSVSASEMR